MRKALFLKAATLCLAMVPAAQAQYATPTYNPLGTTQNPAAAKWRDAAVVGIGLTNSAQASVESSGKDFFSSWDIQNFRVELRSEAQTDVAGVDSTSTTRDHASNINLATSLGDSLALGLHYSIEGSKQNFDGGSSDHNGKTIGLGGSFKITENYLVGAGIDASQSEKEAGDAKAEASQQQYYIAFATWGTTQKNVSYRAELSLTSKDPTHEDNNGQRLDFGGSSNINLNTELQSKQYVIGIDYSRFSARTEDTIDVHSQATAISLGFVQGHDGIAASVFIRKMENESASITTSNITGVRVGYMF